MDLRYVLLEAINERPEDRNRAPDQELLKLLAEHIEGKGLFQPVVLTRQNVLCDGLNRYRTYQYLYKTSVIKDPYRTIPAVYVDCDPEEVRYADTVLRRTCPLSQKLALAASRHGEMAAEALARQKDGKKLSEKSTKGRTLTQLAQWLGMPKCGHRTLGKALEIYKAAVADPANYGDLLDQLDKGGKVDPVYKKLENRRAARNAPAPAPSTGPELHPGIQQNTILTGDSLSLMQSMSSGMFDAVVCDPPYGIAFNYGYDWEEPKTAEQYREWFAPYYQQMRRLVKKGGLLVLFQAIRYHTYFAAWYGKHDLFFVMKTGCRMGNWLNQACDMAVIQRKPGKVLLPQHPSDLNNWVQVHNGDHDAFAKQHPCPKPLNVWERLLTAFVPEGGLVLDPFCGTGGCPTAAQNTGRRFLGIEQNANWADLARKRLAHYQQKQEEAA